TNRLPTRPQLSPYTTLFRSHPQEAIKTGQVIKAQVLEIDTEKRRLRLGMKQLIPTSLDEYIAEHKEGDAVTGRMTDISGGRAKRSEEHTSELSHLGISYAVF